MTRPKGWEIPDERSVVEYLKLLSSQELTEWCLERLKRPPYGPPPAADDTPEQRARRRMSPGRPKRSG